MSDGRKIHDEGRLYMLEGREGERVSNSLGGRLPLNVGELPGVYG